MKFSTVVKNSCMEGYISPNFDLGLFFLFVLKMAISFISHFLHYIK